MTTRQHWACWPCRAEQFLATTSYPAPGFNLGTLPTDAPTTGAYGAVLKQLQQWLFGRNICGVAMHFNRRYCASSLTEAGCAPTRP